MADIGVTISLEGLNKIIADLGRFRDEATKTASEINKTAKGADDAAKSASNFASSILKVGGAVAGLAGVISYFDRIDSALTNTVKTAKSFGIAAETMERWQYAASTAGVEAGRFTQSLEGLNAKAGEALINKMSDSGKAFAFLGVSLRDTQGNFRGVQSVFEQTIEALSRIEDGGTRSRLALALLGPEGLSLANTFREGADQFRNAGDRLTTVADILGEEGYKAFKDANGIVKDFNDTITVLATVGYAAAITEGEKFFNSVALGAKITYGRVQDLMSELDRLTNWTKGNQNFEEGFGWILDGSTSAEANKPKQNKPMQLPRLDPNNLLPKQVKGEEALGKGENFYNDMEMRRKASEKEREEREKALNLSKALEQARAEERAELDRYNATIREASSLYEQFMTPQEKVLQDMERAAELFSQGALSGDEYAKVLSGLQEAYAEVDQTASSFADTITDGLRGMISGGEDLGDQIDNIGKKLLENLANAAVLDPLNKSLTSIFSGAGQAGQPQQDILGGILTTFETGSQKFGDVFSQNIPVFGTLFDNLLGGMGSVFNNLLGGLGSALGGILGSSSGSGIFGGLVKGALSFLPGGGFISSILGFANGGDLIATKPTLFTAAERGPERIRVSPLAGGMGAGGGSGVNVTLPQGSVVSGISAGAFARRIAKEVDRVNKRVV